MDESGFGLDQETKDKLDNLLTKLEWRIVAGLCVFGLGMLIWGMV